MQREIETLTNILLGKVKIAPLAQIVMDYAIPLLVCASMNPDRDTIVATTQGYVFYSREKNLPEFVNECIETVWETEGGYLAVGVGNRVFHYKSWGMTWEDIGPFDWVRSHESPVPWKMCGDELHYWMERPCSEGHAVFKEPRGTVQKIVRVDGAVFAMTDQTVYSAYGKTNFAIDLRLENPVGMQATETCAVVISKDKRVCKLRHVLPSEPESSLRYSLLESKAEQFALAKEWIVIRTREKVIAHGRDEQVKIIWDQPCFSIAAKGAFAFVQVLAGIQKIDLTTDKRVFIENSFFIR